MGSKSRFNFYLYILLFCLIYFSGNPLWAEKHKGHSPVKAQTSNGRNLVICDLALSWLSRAWLDQFLAKTSSPERTQLIHIHLSEMLNSHLARLLPGEQFHGHTDDRPNWIRVKAQDYGYQNETGPIDMPLDIWLQAIFSRKHERQGFSFVRNGIFNTDFIITRLQPDAVANIPKLRLIEARFHPLTFIYAIAE